MLKGIKFDQNGLVVAVCQCADSGRVLMQAYMNLEALETTIKTGYAHYYSRSRKSLWKKGEASGNTQRVVDISLDCDGDCVLLKVKQKGVACHTGRPTCFYTPIKQFSTVADLGVLKDIENAIKMRKENPEKGSYTNHLLNAGKEKICKKIGEEASEVVIAAMKGDKVELANEVADLLFHVLMLLEVEGMGLDAVLAVLQERRNKERERNY